MPLDGARGREVWDATGLVEARLSIGNCPLTFVEVEIGV